MRNLLLPSHPAKKLFGQAVLAVPPRFRICSDCATIRTAGGDFGEQYPSGSHRPYIHTYVWQPTFSSVLEETSYFQRWAFAHFTDTPVTKARAEAKSQHFNNLRHFVAEPPGCPNQPGDT